MCSRHGIARYLILYRVHTMTDENVNIDDPVTVDPIEELRRIVNEQKDVIVKQNESIKKLESRLNDYDRKATASAGVKKEEPKVPEPDPQDVAYRAMLREMGISDKE